MTEKEKEAFLESQRVIKEESKKITDSITRILMVGGPKFVEAILLSLQDCNEKIMKTLKIDSKIEFENAP